MSPSEGASALARVERGGRKRFERRVKDSAQLQPTEKQVSVGEYTINCAHSGSGEPLLLLHGSEPRESWKVWEPLLALGDALQADRPRPARLRQVL